MSVPHKPAVTTVERRRLVFLVISGAGALFLLVGALGLYRYVRGFWLYRGFPPPHDPAFVSAAGRAESIRVTSAAIGGPQPARRRLPAARLREHRAALSRLLPPARLPG
jgi:hypothetical protein